MKKPKQKKCQLCGERFTPFNTLQKACSVECAVAIAKKQAAKQFNRETTRLKDKIKTRQEWAKEAQAAFNRYIRARDAGRPCISCGKPDDGSHQRHASHYRSVGACSALRFNAYNVHASCMQCNAILSGNLVEYRIRLIGKIGEERIEFLERQNHTTKYDIDYLKRLKRIFNKRARRIEKRRNG